MIVSDLLPPPLAIAANSCSAEARMASVDTTACDCTFADPVQWHCY
jgi:hypothetical protein